MKDVSKWIQPIIILDFLEFKISIRVDSSSLLLYIFKSKRGLYDKWLAIQRRVQPPGNTVGINSKEKIFMVK